MIKMDRRDLLKLGLVEVCSLAIATNTFARETESIQQKLQTGPSILQGATDENSTQFSILYHKNVKFGAFVTNVHGKIWEEDKIDYITYPGHHKKIAKIFFSQLNPDDTFYLNVINLETKELLDKREFKMLKADMSNLRFALCSCMDDRHHKPAIWRNIVSQKPDVILFIGDFVYADSNQHLAANPEKLWKRFCDARQTLDIFFSYQLIPILATWDDHDFGLNDSNCENYPFVLESQKNFNSFFAQEESHCRYLMRGPGVSSALKWNSQLFLLLDDRSFRKPKYSKDRYAHWGKEQEDWMLELIEKNNGPTWLINGSQIFPRLIFKESVSGNHSKQFRGFLKELKKLTSKVIFISGDVHFSEISKIEKEILGYSTYEITSSSIHSTNTPGSPYIFPNYRRIAGAGARNFILVDSVSEGTGAQMQVTCIGANGNNYFNLNLAV